MFGRTAEEFTAEEASKYWPASVIAFWQARLEWKEQINGADNGSSVTPTECDGDGVGEPEILCKKYEEIEYFIILFKHCV